MKKHDEISSTEKLLNVIRDDSGVENEIMGLSPLKLPKTEKAFIRSKVFSLRKTVNAGVIIGEREIFLAMTRRSTEGQWELLDYKRIPVDPVIKKEDRTFISFLNGVMTDFCGNYDNCEVWAAISSSRVETRYLTIPKVSEKQIANAVYWTYRKQVSFDDGDVIFDFSVLGDIKEGGASKTKVIAYTAPSDDVNALKKLFSEAGFPLTGISIVPFAYQNILMSRLVEADEKNICILHIGQEWSRIDIFSDGTLVLSRDIKTGVNSVIEAIRGELDSKKMESSMELIEVEDGSIVSPSELTSQTGITAAEKIFKSFSDSTCSGSGMDHTHEKANGHGLNPEDILNMVVPALIRLVRQVERSLEHFSIHFKGETVRKIFISGELSGYKRIVEFISNQLNYRIDYIDLFSSGFFSGNKDKPPMSVTEKDSFSPAIGMALSDNSYTPNLVYTFIHKGAQLKVQNINRAVFVVFIFIIAVFFGIYIWQGYTISGKEAQILNIQEQIAQFNPRVDQQFIRQFAAKVDRDRKSVQEYARKYIGMAVISELTEMTPPNINLINITAKLGRAQENKDKKKTIIIEGIIFDESFNRDSSLAVFLVKLNGSPIFENPRIVKKSIETFGNKEVLKFTARLELV